MNQRWVWAVVAVGLVLPGTSASPAILGPADTTPDQTCPPGEHADTQTAGGRCVPGWCPPGMLLDGITRVCVTAPGLPPPALSGD